MLVQPFGLFGLAGFLHPKGLLKLFMLVQPFGLFGLAGFLHPKALRGSLIRAKWLRLFGTFWMCPLPVWVVGDAPNKNEKNPIIYLLLVTG